VAPLRSQVTGGVSHTSAITLSSYRSPLFSVDLVRADGAGGVNLYECAGQSNEECMVDMLTPPSTNILAGISTEVYAEPGIYDRVSVSLCPPSEGPETGTPFKVSGQFDMDGQTFYTTSDGKLSTTGPAEEATISIVGCRFVSELQTPFEVVMPAQPDAGMLADAGTVVIDPVANAVIDLKLFYNLDSLLTGIKDFPIPGPDGFGSFGPECASQDPVEGEPQYALCTDYPIVSGTLDTGEPILERYRLDNAVTIGIFATSSGYPFGAYIRSFFVEGVENTWTDGMGHYAGINLGSLEVHDDGTVTVTGSDPSAFTADHFSRESHSGTLTLFGQPKAYTATKLAN